MMFIKKVTAISVVTLGVASCFSNIYAAETGHFYESISKYGFVSNPRYATTVGDYNFVPELRLYQETRNSKVYLIMSVNDTGMNATVNGSSNNIVRDDIYHFSYQVTKSGWYEVYVWGNNQVKRHDSIYITLGDDQTDIDLSKEYKNGDCYLKIDVDDADGIKNISVNDVSISFNSSDGTASYRVYNSGTYKVIVTDKNDNRKTESIYINVNADAPTLSLSKKYKSGKWYLVIKADSDNSISKVTVDGSKVSFPSNGGTEEYEVTKSGTYKVVVTDQGGYTKSDSLYIDVYEKDSKNPTVKLSQNYKTNNNPGWYLLINASDDNGIASVTVNGVNVSFDQSKGLAQYYVPVDGTYTIVVTDKQGNSTTTTTYAAGNASINAGNNGNYSNLGSTKIIFKLNSKSWTQDGIKQETMTVAPKVMYSRVYLPIRYIAYALDIDSGNIIWDSSNKTVKIYDGNNVIKVKVGSKVMYVNDKAFNMDAAPTEINGRVMLPISQIKTAFSNKNIQLSWDNINKQLTILR